VESELREKGFFVFSNASAHRYDEDVPILIPEVNIEELTGIKNQMIKYNGVIVTNANCSTTGLAVALAPLKNNGILDVFVSTYQSISGAGYPGVASLDIMGNIVPFIDKEENKIQVELQKIFKSHINIFPFCARVPVIFGHLETVWVRFKKHVELEGIKKSWQDFKIEPSTTSIPDRPVQYLKGDYLPQNKISFRGDPPGMPVFTGRLKKEGDYIGFVLLVNNIVKGGAGGSIQNAELFKKLYGELL
jgi:aspartate-semialdehyde dehydrogenase